MSAGGGLGSDRGTLADRIHQLLEDDIWSGQLEPGSRLLIVPLAKRFGTSQAPVREAIRRLTEEGLAATQPYVGTVLKEPSWDEVVEIFELRAELEAYAVRRIASRPRISFRSDHPIKRALRELQRAVRAGAPMGIVDADSEFHRAVCANADSPVTLELWSTITKRVRGIRASYESKVSEDLSTLVDTHRVLLEALESGDPKAAEEAFRGHLAGAVRRLSSASE